MILTLGFFTIYKFAYYLVKNYHEFKSVSVFQTNLKLNTIKKTDPGYNLTITKKMIPNFFLAKASTNKCLGKILL